MCTWFKHDSLASRDKKLVRLRADHGRNGVCMFWDILELMAYDNDHWIDLDIKQLYYLLGISSRKDKELLKQLILNNKYELFEYADSDSEYITPPPTVEELQSGGYRFTSRRLRESLEGISVRDTQARPNKQATTEETQEDRKERRAYNLSEEGRARLQQGAKKSRRKRTISTESQEISTSNLNDNVKQPQQAISTQSQNIKNKSQDESQENWGAIGGEEREETKEIEKDRERGGKALGRFSPPTLQEVQDYCQSKGYAWDAEAFWFYYESNGWMVGRNKMKNWRSACANWNKREDSTYRNWQAGRSTRAPALIGSTAIPIDSENIPTNDNW